MRRIVFAILAVLVSAAAAAGGARDWRQASPLPLERLGPREVSPSVRCPPGDTARLDSILQSVMDSFSIPGMATMVVQDGRATWNRCYGYAILGDSINDSVPVTDTTCFSLASVSKTVTGMAMMQLWENGYFDLDGSINESLPFPVRHSRFPDSTITFKMLMTHTSGIRDNYTNIFRYLSYLDPDSSMRAFLEDYFIPGQPGYDSANNFYQNLAPGEGFQYSNVAVTLGAFGVEVMAESFPMYTRDSIFRPLGMDRTTWFFGDLDTMSVACQYEWSEPIGWYRYGYTSGALYPAAFLKSCTRDLGIFLNTWLAHGRHDSLQLLDSATVGLMLTPYVWDPLTQTWQGLIWYHSYTADDTLWCHQGAWYGVTTYVGISRRDNSGIIVLTNGHMQYEAVFDRVAPALHAFASRAGIAEQPGPSVDWQPRSTLVHGTLFLASSPSSSPSWLLDISGRRVAELRAGDNDIRHLAPGIYFVRSEPSAVRCQPPAVQKVIVTR